MAASSEKKLPLKNGILQQQESNKQLQVLSEVMVISLQ